MQFSYSICEIWCIPFGNILLKIHFFLLWWNIGYYQSYSSHLFLFWYPCQNYKIWPLKRKMGVWGEIAPLKAKKVQFSNSICAIWCTLSANNLLKIQYSFPIKIFAIIMSIPPTFPLFFYDKILAISRLFLRLSCSDTFVRTIINLWPLKREKNRVSEEAETRHVAVTDGVPCHLWDIDPWLPPVSLLIPQMWCKCVNYMNILSNIKEVMHFKWKSKFDPYDSKWPQIDFWPPKRYTPVHLVESVENFLSTWYWSTIQWACLGIQFACGA